MIISMNIRNDTEINCSKTAVYVTARAKVA